MKKILLSLIVFQFVSCDFGNKKYQNSLNKAFDVIETESLQKSELEKYLHKIAIRINNISGDTIKKDYYYRLANFYWNNGNYSLYKKYVLKGIIESNAVNSDLSIARGYRKLGEYYCRPPYIKRDSAYYFLRKAWDIYYREKDYASLAKIDLIQGDSSFFEGDFNEAEIYAQNALNYFRNTSHYGKKIHCYTLIGVSNLESKNFQQADKYLNAAYSLIVQKAYSNTSKAGALNNMGKSFLEQSRFDLAQNCFEKGLYELKLKQDDPLPKAVLIENLAIVKSKTNIHSPEIPELFYKAITLKDSLNFEEVGSRVNFSNYYLEKGDYKNAIAKANEAFEISQKKSLRDKMLAVQQLIKTERNSDKKRIQQFLSLVEELKKSKLVQMKNIMKMNQEFDSAIRLKDKQLYLKHNVILQLCLILVLLGSVTLIRFVLYRKRQIQWLHKEREMNRKIYHLMMEQQYVDAAARNDEKRRIAGDLHDSVINSLTVIRLNLNLLGIRSKEETMEEVFIYANQIQKVEKEIRDISYDTYFFTNNFNYGVRQMLRDIISHKKILGFKGTVNLNLSENIPWFRLNMKQQFNLFAILREGFLNALKHSSASKLELKGYFLSENLEFEINDNGVGFNTKDKGLGMESMFNRAKKINASLQINSIINEGTIILLNFKL